MNLFLLFVCITALRLLISGSLGLGDDEAYYWEYSRHLARVFYIFRCYGCIGE